MYIHVYFRLSERNCIEIVSWLIDKKKLDLIFTSDGKEYLTPDQLVRDIRGELYDAGGRVSLVDLAKLIRVDLGHINAHLNEVLKGNKDIHCVLSQLIDNAYIIKLAEEINEKLSQQGQINIGDLTIQYDLPADFLQQQVLEKNLGKLIFGKQDKNDPRVLFTGIVVVFISRFVRYIFISLCSVSLVFSLYYVFYWNNRKILFCVSFCKVLEIIIINNDALCGRIWNLLDFNKFVYKTCLWLVLKLENSFPESFVAKNKAKMKGALAALTRPTSVASILGQINMSEKIFFSLFDQVALYGTLTSRLSGAQYIPNVYARSQVTKNLLLMKYFVFFLM